METGEKGHSDGQFSVPLSSRGYRWTRKIGFGQTDGMLGSYVQRTSIPSEGVVKLLAVSCLASWFIDLSGVMCFSLTYQTGKNGRCPQAESKPSNVTCNEGSNTCLDGSCTGSICALFEITECECHQNTDQLCHVCCNNSGVSITDL